MPTPYNQFHETAKKTAIAYIINALRKSPAANDNALTEAATILDTCLSIYRREYDELLQKELDII